MTTLGFTYMFCDDIASMKRFYRDMLALELIWEREDHIAFQIGEHQLSIQYHREFTPPSPAFSIQPGWQGGEVPRTGWSIGYDRKVYFDIVERLREYGAYGYFSEPQWKGYWSFPVLDPMHNTIEITCAER